jgi:hypothetical protein
MCACRYLTLAVLAALALQTSLQAQERDSGRGRGLIHLEWPFTAEYHLHEHHQNRPEAERDYILVMANDSQGRDLSRSIFADGRSAGHVFDPVAAQQIWWATDSTKAKIVKYPTPVADRSSCWRRPWSERSSSSGRTLGYEFKTRCAPAGPPAGQGQFPDCRDASYTEDLAKALPPETKGFPKCDAPGGTAEDLGMSVIQGIAAHGCRRTAPDLLTEGNVLTENWSDEYGLTLREIDEHPNGDRFLREIISLSRDEPDLSTFQPPKGYEGVTLEMDEVPCEPLPMKITYWLPDLPIDARQ